MELVKKYPNSSFSNNDLMAVALPKGERVDVLINNDEGRTMMEIEVHRTQAIVFVTVNGFNSPAMRIDDCGNNEMNHYQIEGETRDGTGVDLTIIGTVNDKNGVRGNGVPAKISNKRKADINVL